MEIGVRELKEHLSAYLDRAAAGETITVTDRGRPKAVLCAPASPNGALAAGIAAGWIRPADADRRLVAVRRAPSRRRVLDVLDDDRGAENDLANEP